MCKRLKVLVPILIGTMERHGHLDLNAMVKAKLLQVSAATINRVLGVGAVIRRSVPVRTFSDWRDPPQGFFEVDIVEHCGGAKTDGDFVHSLVLTDIASGWTECIAMPVRNELLVVEALSIAATDLPFPMLRVDTDNDSAFMSQSEFDYCKDNALEQTRSRAYKKNDQAWVEQKNGAIVRRHAASPSPDCPATRSFGGSSGPARRSFLSAPCAARPLSARFPASAASPCRSRTADGRTSAR